MLVHVFYGELDEAWTDELPVALAMENPLGLDQGVGHIDGLKLPLLLPLSLIHISEPTRPLYISYAAFC